MGMPCGERTSVPRISQMPLFILVVFILSNWFFE
jgi:hypothetical protein